MRHEITWKYNSITWLTWEALLISRHTVCTECADGVTHEYESRRNLKVVELYSISLFEQEVFFMKLWIVYNTPSHTMELSASMPLSNRVNTNLTTKRQCTTNVVRGQTVARVPWYGRQVMLVIHSAVDASSLLINIGKRRRLIPTLVITPCTYYWTDANSASNVG